MTIDYTIVSSPLGSLLVAGTARGLRAVSFGSSASALERVLAGQHPGVTLRRDATVLQPWVEAILCYLDGDQTALDLPVDVPGTPLQTQVWEALRQIPYGTTQTYGEIAKGLDPAPTAQEVGQACASNPVAVVVPCHRVIKADGSLAGYRWGVARKRQLLEHEGALAGVA
jgi:AraC family transcriptional regulator of adaptative response/methylated-DNA-[protein]-cysteine methyltransferase